MFAEVNNQNVVTFPYDYDTLVRHNPSTRFTAEELTAMYVGTEANLAGNQLVRVVVADAPQYDEATQIAVRNNQPSLVGGTWTIGWIVQELTQSEKDQKLAAKIASVRSQRNQKLKDSDWSQGKDIPDAVSTPWATYRQALRDVPQQSGFPWDVTWPTQPE
jgi:hypothetical protein